MSDVELPPLPATSWQLNHDDATGTEIDALHPTAAQEAGRD